MAAQHARGLGLQDTKNLRGLSLAEVAVLDDLANLGGKNRLDLHLSSIGQAEVFVDVSRSFFKIDQSTDRNPLLHRAQTPQSRVARAPENIA